MGGNRLILPEAGEHTFVWNETLHRMLEVGGVFEVERRPVSSPNGSEGYFPRPHTNDKSDPSWSTIEVNGALVGIDTWDTYAPTRAFARASYFEPAGQLRDIELILKLQHHSQPYWDAFPRFAGKRVSAWTIMPMHQFPLTEAPFRWRPNGHRYVAGITGKNERFGREAWRDWAREQPDFFTARLPLDEYYARMREWRWGVVLRGHPMAVKNRREFEFAACGLPLALTYVPEYPFPMEPGVDFVHVEKPEDLARLRDLDPMPFAAASRRLYEKYFSPTGMSRLLLALLEGRSPGG